jgi:hypothetical protein
MKASLIKKHEKCVALYQGTTLSRAEKEDDTRALAPGVELAMGDQGLKPLMSKRIQHDSSRALIQTATQFRPILRFWEN